MAQFNPLASFAGGKSSALGIKAQEQGLARESAAAPIRNQLGQLDVQKSQLGLDRAKTGIEREGQEFDQSQALRRITLLNQGARAIGATDPSQWDQAIPQVVKFLGEQGIDAQELAQGVTPESLGSFITQTDELIRDPRKMQQATTSLQKNLAAAGLQPGSPEFKQAVLSATQKPNTQISIGAEKKFASEVAKGQAKTFGRIGEEADKAIDANQSLDVLESIDVDTGALEPAKQGIAAFAQAFGIPTGNLANISKGEAFNAEAKRIVLAVKASQKGPQTDKDEETIRSTVANLGNTKAGNQFIIDSARALNTRRIERKEFYDLFIEESGGSFKDESGKTADRAWADFKRKTPMISTNLRTPEGLPVFFYKFESGVRDANPQATRAEILEFWKLQNKRTK